jgi:hypothetical protein
MAKQQELENILNTIFSGALSWSPSFANLNNICTIILNKGAFAQRSIKALILNKLATFVV